MLEGHSRQGRARSPTNPLGIPLPGCPLDEKISEMHLVRKRGDAIGALAIVMIDNPMCPGTGHRICNDCMKACIYQKQEPVNIPQIETGVLTDVLKMPWGVEIYGLLTRWNPLNVERPYALPYNGKNVLVVGLGPAGYTLAHYLLNEGFGVVGDRRPQDRAAARRHHRRAGHGRAASDSRLERDLPRARRARARRFRRRLRVRHHGPLGQELPHADPPDAGAPREAADLRRHPLRRHRSRSRKRGSCGIDHVAIAAGAGRPTIIDIKNNLIRGIRKASDFLMALQLTGAFKSDALSNLQVRLPAVVIGGGLTGVDTATELMAYYPIQVEKMLERYEALVRDLGEARVRGMMDAEEHGILDEFLVARPRRPGRARAGGRGGREAGLHRADPRLGRRHARLSQAPAGFAGVPPESRGSDARRSRRASRSPRT